MVKGAADAVATNNYDADVTAEFRAFMAQSWAVPEDGPLEPLPVAAWAAKRRKALSAAFPGEVLILASGRLVPRSNDTHYRFRPRSEYVWCTGHQDEGGVLVMVPRGAKGHVATLFVRPRSVAGTEPFYRDRNYGELWVGRRPGVEETEQLFGIACRPLGDLAAVIAKQVGAGRPVRCVRGVDAGADKAAGRARRKADAELERWLSEARLLKDEWEVEELQQAVDATLHGFEDVIKELPTATGERWLEGTFIRRARHEGNDVGYNSIVACGDHATILHWTDDDGALVPGELGLLDMGVEGHNLYTADVTRTIPLNGSFSKAQKRVYKSVLKAQQAGIEAAVAGASFIAPHVAAMRSIIADLVEWGLLAGEVDDLLKADVQRRYTLHGTSHMLGIDVHDCAKARNEFYKGGVLQPGMVLTVEPGLYFQRDDLTAPEDLRGIGVRIEDDIVISAVGPPRVLTANIPKKAGDIERWMKALQKPAKSKR